MSDYTKVYDGAAKDAAEATLAGSDFDTEFSAIETAVATKADKVGTPTTNGVALLDANGNLIDSGNILKDASGNEILHASSEALAVNYLKLIASATGNAVELQALGDDTNINIKLTPKGSGVIEGLDQTRGALVYKLSDQSCTVGVGSYLSWDAEEYDTDSIHDNATNNSRLTVPAGVSLVRLRAKAYYTYNILDNGVVELSILKNGGSAWAGYASESQHLNAYGATYKTGMSISVVTPMISVTPGDYFQAYFWIDHGSAPGTIGVNSGQYSWFAMEIVG